MFVLFILVDLLTIIVCSATEQTLMVNKSTNINRTNIDGQQVHQYQQNKK
jgi:hypothetical protein